jgi:hypothetical protein
MNYRDIMEDALFLEPEWLDEAIIGRTDVGGCEVIAYSYEGLVSSFMKHESMDFEAATEWVEFNTLRTLPYMGNQAPVVVYLRSEDAD